jgi:hypothetical protein
MAGARTGTARLAAWSCFLALTLRLLHGAAFARLSIPLGSLDELAGWADQTSPTVMALAVVRLVALVAAWYLTGATILAVVADVAGWRRLAAVVAALSPSLVRRLASRSAGVGLAAGALLAVTPMPQRVIASPASASSSSASSVGASPATGPTNPAHRSVPPDPPSAMTPPAPGPADPATPTGSTGSKATRTRLPGAADMAIEIGGIPPPTTTAPPAPPAAGADPAQPSHATMTRLPGPTVPGSGATATMIQIAWSSGTAVDSTGPHSPPAPTRTPTPTDSRDPVEPWTVAPGDSFWSIAEEILTDIAGHEPTEQAIRHYWVQLIETNRRRLADPANPDLLFPGQLLDLPDPT